MKTKLFLAAGLIGVAVLSAQAGVGVGINIGIPAPPIVVAPPAPVVVAPSVAVVVPDTYVWDGYENVGVVNGAYFYLSGNVWLPLDAGRAERFHGWERDHHDWRDHATRNENFRGDAHKDDHGHDRDHDGH